MTYSDMLVRIDWNDRISAEENSRRTKALVAAVEEHIDQSTVMAGVQQFVLSHTDETSVTEAVVYLKCHDAADVAPVQRTIRNYIAEHAPEALCSFGVSGNIFDMIFAEREARLTARLRSTSGRAADPEQLQSLIDRIRAALPDQPISPVALQEDILYVARPEQMALYGTDHVAVGEITAAETYFETIVVGYATPDRRHDSGDIFGRGCQVERVVISFCACDDLFEIRVHGLTHQNADRNFGLGRTDEGLAEQIVEVTQVVADHHGKRLVSGRDCEERVFVQCIAQRGDEVVALLLLFFILAAQFESLVQPWIILSEIVIDLFGALIVLWFFGVSLNLMSMIGLIVVCGIVINDSILKIDTINTLRRQGVSLKHAILEAGQRRLKAIVMTSLTTILAVLPFLARGDMGSDLQFPMSLVIISGMTVGTLVSVFFIPLAYYEIYKPRR